MNEWLTQLIQRYRRLGILLDANLLLLYVVGAVDRDRIGKWKRTEKFLADDYDLLVAIVSRFERVVTTPNILTEVSNFLGQMDKRLIPPFLETFGASIAALTELHTPSNIIAVHPEFKKLRLTDTGIFHSASEYLVITVDFPLSNSLQAAGLDVINFNHIRSLNWP
jgi:hypothetical protein